MLEEFQVTHQFPQSHLVHVYHIVTAARNHSHLRRREGWIRTISWSLIASDGTLVLVADVLQHNTGSAGIKKGWPINVIARPFKANI